MSDQGGYHAPPRPEAGYAGVETEALRPRGPLVLAWLVIVDGPYTGRLFRLNPGATVLGRDATCDVVLDDSTASRRHAKVRVVEGEDRRPRFILHDLASENGTLLNGEDIVKHELNDGDYVKIGRTELVFKQVVPKKGEV